LLADSILAPQKIPFEQCYGEGRCVFAHAVRIGRAGWDGTSGAAFCILSTHPVDTCIPSDSHKLFILLRLHVST
jgi:hypothetical protein